MNTKILFLLLLALLAANTTSSLILNKKESSVLIGHATNAVVTEAASDPVAHPEIPVSDVPQKNTKQFEKTHKPNSDDDGKHHHFHFGRISRRRSRRVAVVVLSKVLLTVAHIACFLYCFFHLMH